VPDPQTTAVAAVVLAALRADIAQGLRHVAVVRFDAFGDMGGRLSSSAAVVGGESDATLTSEEQQALTSARTGSQRA
jgi:hypothetical protein